MPTHFSGRRLPNMLVASLMLFGMLAGLTFVNVATPATASGHTMTPDYVRLRPERVYAGHAQSGKVFSCQSNTSPLRCYAPAQIQQAYNIKPLLDAGYTGKGRTIVIIDAYQSPTIAHDLQLFDSVFNLKNPTLNIIQQPGMPTFDINDALQTGWAGEITLDVEWAHAVAPDATIDLVEAKSSYDQDLYTMTKYAVDHNLGDVISQSFGEAESCMDPTILKLQHHLFFEAALKGISVFASAGDQGAAQPTCDGNSYALSASTPASDPFVTGVGGTNLNADAVTGAYQGETVWNENVYALGAGGGGFSTIYHKPFYQYGIGSVDHYRGVPDVSYSAGVNDGVLTVFSSSGQGSDLVFINGGTSAGSPQWAGITALGVQMAHHRLGLLNSTLYGIAHTGLYHYAFHDVTSGDNSFTAPDANGNNVTVQGYSAHSGWDAASGLGSPNVAHLISLLAGSHCDANQLAALQ